MESLQKQIKTLSRKIVTLQKEKKLDPRLETDEPELRFMQIWHDKEKLYVRPPRLKSGPAKFHACRMALHEAGRSANAPTAKWDKELKAWTFKRTPKVEAAVMKVLGDFYSTKDEGMNIVNENGELIGQLDKSTYVPPQA